MCAGRILPDPRGNPRKWGTGGKRSYGHAVPVGRVPRRSFGYFPIAGKVPRPAGRNPARSLQEYRAEKERRGHTPGWLLSAFGRFTFSPSPTGFKKIFRDWVGEALGPPAVNRPSTVGSTNPGAVVKSQPLQFSTRPGPSGPKEIAECHSNFARRKFSSISQVRVPRKRGLGKAVLWT